MNIFEDSSPLFPCSGRELAETINVSERAEYDFKREDLLRGAEQTVLDLIKLDRFAFDQIYQFDQLVRKNLKIRISTAGSLKASLKHLAMTAITAGASGLERTEEKLVVFHSYLSALLDSGYSSIDSQVIDILNYSYKNISEVGIQNLSRTIYDELDSLRRDKTSITTKMSRIRRVAEMIIEPDSKIARELGEARLGTQADARDWIDSVSSAFMQLNPQLSKFGSSYEKSWYMQCQEVIERNQRIRIKERPRNYHLVEKLLTNEFSNTFTDTSRFSSYEKASKALQNQPDYSTQHVTMDLKVASQTFEARFGLPKNAASLVPNLQISVLQFLAEQMQDIEFEVSSDNALVPTILVSASLKDVRKFGDLQLKVMNLLESEIEKFLK